MQNMFGHKLVMLGNTRGPKPIRIPDTYVKTCHSLTFRRRLGAGSEATSTRKTKLFNLLFAISPPDTSSTVDQVLANHFRL